MLTKEELNRYARQILLPEIGLIGQEKLKSAKVLVIGAGGLGCPAIQYLAAAGIGTLGIVDFDVVQLSNLHRQILYNHQDINQNKAEVAANKIAHINPHVNSIVHALKVTSDNVHSILGDFDLVLDCTDNFAARYVIDKACAELKKPLVYGGIFRFEGQVSVFHYGPHPVGYADVFPENSEAQNALDCNAAGVLGTLPGIIGTMQAQEAIKIIVGAEEVLAGKIFVLNTLSSEIVILQIPQKQ
jgi:sulfur-carrier protein adenylyltransferase/sulfurtransferase